MEISLNQIVLLVTTIGGLISTYLQSRKTRRAEERAQKAEFQAKEMEIQAKEFENIQKYIENADAMIELVMTANEKTASVQNKVIDDLKKENEKIKDTTELLQQVISSINLCPYRADCPVYRELQKHPTAPYRIRRNRDGIDKGGSKGHGNPDRKRPSPHSGAAGMRQCGEDSDPPNS